MNTVLSVQGASAPVKKKSFFSKFTRLNMLRLARAVIPVAVLMMLFPELAMAAAFNMKQTVDAFFDSASQKQLSEAQSKALSARFNTALEASLQAWQQKHHAVILVSPAVVQGVPDITREIQQDIARRMRAEP